MATTKKAATTPVTEVKEKKQRKPREKKVKVAVLRQHPKYPEFLQALSVDGWVLIEPVGNWQVKVPLLHPSIGETVHLVLGEDSPIKVITPDRLATFTLGCFSDKCCTGLPCSDGVAEPPELGNAGSVNMQSDADFTEDDFSDDDDYDEYRDNSPEQ